MEFVNIYEAKTHFSHLVNRALEGEEVIIAKAGVPLLKLTLYEKPKSVRKGGQLKGILLVKDSFDKPLPDDFG